MKTNPLFSKSLLFAGLLGLSASTFAQSGTIQIRQKAISEEISPDFSYTTTGTGLSSFTLNDKPDALYSLYDLAGDAAGGQWAVAATYSYSPLGWNSSIDLNPGVIYYKSPGTTVWTSTGVDAFKVHGISGSCSFFSLKRNTPISEYRETADQINYRASSLAPIVDISYNLVGERFIAISSDGDDMLYVLVKTGEFDGYNIGTIYKKTLSATSWTSTGITGVLSMAAVPYTPAQAGKIAYATYTAISSTGSCAYIAMNDGTSVTNYGHPTTNYYTLDNVTPIYNEAGNIELWARRGFSMRKSSTPGTWMATGVNDMRGVASTSGKILMTIMQDGSNSVLIPRRIFTKSQTGVWFDDERVRTAEMANTVTFNVTPGTYTITQNAVTGWHLTDITVDETTTAGTSINKVTKSVTVTVSDKELVMIEFENQVTETSITTLSNICGEEGFVEDFSSYKNGNWGNPVEGMISYHKATSSFGYGHYAVMSTIYPTMHYGVSGMYDHTEGDTTGAMLVVDATFEPGTFYRRSFTGLIAGGKYSMGAWITNYNPPAGDKPNVSFEIYSVATGNLLASASSGNVLTSDWHNFNLIYESDGSDIEIVLRNNTPGTAGNDLAIDDISLSLTPLAPVAAVTSYDCISGATLEVTAPIAIGSLSYEYSIDGTNWQTSPTFTGLAAIAYNVQARYAGSSTGSCVSSTPVTISNAGCISVLGNVFNDPDGGNVNNSTGGPNNIPSGIYANLVDDDGKVVASVLVNTNGSYGFTGVAAGSGYTVQLSNVEGTIGTPPPAFTAPTGWIVTGAYNGTPNTGNTGVLTGTSAAFTVASTNVENINFGIEQISTSDVKSYTLPTQPIVDDEISLSGLSGAPIMSGTDPEDGTYTGNTGTQNNPTGVVITSLPTHGELLYNGTLVTSTDVTDGTVFPDPSLFTVKLTGSGYDSTKFDYAYVDAAGITGTSNTYTLTWESPLPIRLLSFEAIAKGNTAVLTWTTASEQNNKGFEVERSTDGSNWESIGFVATLANEGNSTAPLDYTYSDNAPLQGTNFYRLKQVDINGKYEYSGVRTVNFAAQSSIVLSPNPTSGIINISGLSKGNNQIVVTNAIGQQILNTNITNQSTYNIDLHRFVSGVYYISINNESGIISNHKVVKQ